MRSSQPPVACGDPLVVNITLFLSRSARQRSQEPALFVGRTPWASYGELARRVASMAAGLRARALKPGDRVAFVMHNTPWYLEALYAAWWAGLAVVPVNAKLHPKEVRFILEDSGAKLVFASADWHCALREALAGLDPMPDVIETGSAEYAGLAREAGGEPAPVAAYTLAWLFYTSGTTGRPKGAMLSHANLARMTQSYFASVEAVSPAGRLVHAAPISHGSGLYTFTHLSQGAAQVVPESGGFDPAELLDLLTHHERASLFAAPTMVKRLTQVACAGGGARAPGLQTLVYGGGPMYLSDIRAAIETFGNRFAQIYGQGETPMTITALTKAHHADRAHPRYLERLASVGVAQDGIELAVRDPEGRDLPAGEVGEICVRGGTVMAGYWRQSEATARALRDGWLWTGDLGALDADGFLTLKDRSKDLIISGGSNIYPREVEEVLLAHPAVAEASVVGAPDPEWGERVVAFVVARGAAPERESLDRWCLEHIARFKRPKEYRFVEALPKNNYGKVLKTELRKQLG